MRLDEVQQRLRATRGKPRRDARRGRAWGEEGAPRVALGSDHGGYALKEQVRELLHELGTEVEDLGAHSPDPVDYPDVAAAVARRVACGACRFGIVIDAAGLGSCMAANKVRGVRAATCHDETTVRNSREHNDANVLVLGARVVTRGHARRLVRLWLATPFAGGRHARRVAKIDALDGERPASS